MKKEFPTKEQVLEAVTNNETLTQAQEALGIKHPELMKLLRQYGIAVHGKKRREPDYKQMYTRTKEDLDKAHEWLKDNTLTISALQKESHAFRESRDYFRKRLASQQEATEWLLKRTPWIIRYFYHKKWDASTAPWASGTILAINKQVKEEKHAKR